MRNFRFVRPTALASVVWAASIVLSGCGSTSEGSDEAPPPTEETGEVDDSGEGGDSSVPTEPKPTDQKPTGSKPTGSKPTGSKPTGTEPAGPKPDPYGQTVEPTQASVQTKLVTPYCVACHGAVNPAAALNLTDLSPFLAEGDTTLSRGQRFLIVPGKPELSLLVRVLDEAPGQMPPPGNSLGIPAVKPAQKQALEAWIRGL